MLAPACQLDLVGQSSQWRQLPRSSLQGQWSQSGLVDRWRPLRQWHQLDR